MKDTTITVEVTAEDIAEGVPDNCRYCPIALAIGRHFHQGEPAQITVMPCHVEVITTRDIVEVRLPKVATTFIHRFDKEKPVKPITFHLIFR